MNCLYAFNGELMCFVHVLLNAKDMTEKGIKTTIVLEGASVTLIPKLEKESTPFHDLYLSVKEAGLFDGACKACSAKLNVLDDIRDSGIHLIGDMAGHPSMAEYMQKGYTIITF